MAEREIKMRMTIHSDAFREAMGQREHDRQLGEVTRLAFAGAWLVAVAARDAVADTARLDETMRLMQRVTMLAAHGKRADAIDSARLALACCPGVPALAADVACIIAILEAP